LLSTEINHNTINCEQPFVQLRQKKTKKVEERKRRWI